MTLPLFMPAIAEIWMAASTLTIVVLGVFLKSQQPASWSRAAIIILVGAVLLGIRHYEGPIATFDNMFIQDNLALVFKGVIAVGSILAILLAMPFFATRTDHKFEYPLLILLATIGMFGMVSAQDFLSLYVSLELQSLSLYVLASFRRDEKLNSEAGLKYFFLGALSSGILLYGISLLYGYAGGTSYIALQNTLSSGQVLHPGVVFGLVLVLSAMAFKVAAAPFHMWAPDVYQGASTPVTALFAMVPKIASVGVLCRLIIGPFAPVFEQSQQILVILAVASMAVGSFAAIAQHNIKRLMAYGSIGHIGFILVGLSAGGAEGVSSALFYGMIYLIMSAGGFAFILSIYNHAEGDEQTAHLAGLSKHQPVMAACFAVLLLSMAGIPPMVGFFAKIYVFAAALNAGLAWLVVAGVLFSVVSAYYYLRLIKIMYFDPAQEIAPVINSPLLWRLILVVSALLNIILLIYPKPVSDLATWAVQSL